MFEKYISNILVSALSQYAEDIDPKQLQLKIFSGTATLNNLKLKSSAFDGLGLPFKLSRAICKRINIDIPIRNLQSKPCVAEVDELYVIFKSPLDDEASEEVFREAERLAKEAVVAAYEAERKKRAVEKGEDDSGFVSRLTEVIINNVVVNIKNVHVRFERPSHGIIFGALFKEVSVRTTDADGKAAFIDPQTAIKVNKSLSFSGLQLYAEPQAVVKGSMPKDASKFLLLENDMGRWQEGMLRRIQEGSKAGSTIFGPVNGTFIAEVMFQHKIKANPSIPYAVVRVNLQNFVAKLSRQQYLTILDIAAQATNASLMTAIQHFRPAYSHSDIIAQRGPRGTNKAAQAWWRYAARAINEVGLYKRKREIRSKLLMPRYCYWLEQTVVSEIVSGNESLLKIPEYSSMVLSDKQIALRESLFDRMTSGDIVKCRHASQGAISKAVVGLRGKIAALQSEQAQRRSSSWFSWGKSESEKENEKMLDELEKEWGIDGPEVSVDIGELPSNYEWLRLSISLGVGGVHLLLNEKDAVQMNLNQIIIGSSIYNAPGKDSTSFTFTAEEWTVSNPDPKTKDTIPYLISRFSPENQVSSPLSTFGGSSGSHGTFSGSASQLGSSSRFLSVSGATKPIGSNVDFRFRLALQPLFVVADPTFLSQMGQFFVIPPTLDLTALTHTTQAYVSSAAAQASEVAAAAVTEAKVIDAAIDIRAPVAIIPQSTELFDGPCVVVSLGRLRFEASPFSDEEKRDPRLAEELHYYRNQAELTDLFVTCGSFRRTMADPTDGFTIVSPIHLSAKILMKTNSMDTSRPTVVLDCQGKGLKVGLSTHTAFLITSMTSLWALKAKHSIVELEDQAQVLPSQRAFASNGELFVKYSDEQRRIIDNAVELAQKVDGAARDEIKGTLLKATVKIEHFALELYDDCGVAQEMKTSLDADPAAFLNDRSNTVVPVFVPTRRAISNHPQFVLKTSPLTLAATVFAEGGLEVNAALSKIEGFQNYLSRDPSCAPNIFNTQVISSSLTVLGGGANLAVAVSIKPQPVGGDKLPMLIDVELQNVVELHLCTPLLLMLESAMDVVNMLLGAIDDIEADGKQPANADGNASQSDSLGASSPQAALPSNEPKLTLAFRSAGLKALLYNNYYYTNKDVRALQDALNVQNMASVRANASRSQEAHRNAIAAKAMAVDNDVSFDHIRMREDYVFASAMVSGLDVAIRLHTVTMDIEGSLRSFTVDSTDVNLPPMYRTIIRPSSVVGNEAMLMFVFSKKEREYPIIFEDIIVPTDEGSTTKRVLRDADTFESSSSVQACIEPALLVYDQPTIMSLLDWATSGFLSRLSAVSTRPRYDGKFMIPPPPVPKKVMELSIEVKSPTALLPCNPRRGRIAAQVDHPDGDDSTYAGSDDHLEAVLDAVSIRSSLSVAQLTQTIRIELSGFSVSEKVSSGKATTIIPRVGISLHLANNLDSTSTDPQRVLVRMVDAPLQLVTTPSSLTRVLTLFANNVLNLDPPPAPPLPAGLLESRREELRIAETGRASALAAVADADAFVQVPSSITPSKPTIVDLLIGSIELKCQDSETTPQFDLSLSTLKVQLLPDQKKISWSSLIVLDTRPSHTALSADADKLLICDASTVVLRSVFEDHDEGAVYTILADAVDWFEDRKCASWNAGEAGMDTERLHSWLPDAAAREGSPLGTDNKGSSVNTIEIDFEIKRFALTAQWLHVFDYLLNEANMGAMAPMLAPKGDGVEGSQSESNSSRLSLSLTARKFVVPLLSNTSEVLFTASLDRLSVAFGSNDCGGVSAKQIHVTIGSVGLTHEDTGKQILYSSSEGSQSSPLLDISLLIGNNATIISVFMKELNAYISMPIINQLIFYASDSSQPMSQIAQLGVMREERDRLAAIAQDQAKKGKLHMGLHWLSPVLSVPCNSQQDAAVVGRKPLPESSETERLLTVHLGDLTTVLDLINTDADIQPATKTKVIPSTGLIVSEPAHGLPTIKGQRSDTIVAVNLNSIRIDGLLERTSVSVNVSRSAWTPLAPAAARYVEEHAGQHELFSPPSTTSLTINLSPTTLTTSHQSLQDTTNALFLNILLPTDVPASLEEGDVVAEEAPIAMPPVSSCMLISFRGESLSANLFDRDGTRFSSFHLRGIQATVGGCVEEDADVLDAFVEVMDAQEYISGHNMLTTTSEKKSIEVHRSREPDNLIATEVKVSGVYFVFVPKILGSIIDLVLTPLSDVATKESQVDGEPDVPDVDSEPVASRSKLTVSMEALGVDLLQARAGTAARPVISLRLDRSHLSMESGKMVALSAITGDATDTQVLSASDLSVMVGRVEILNKTVDLSAKDGVSPNALFETLVRHRSDCGSTSEFVTVRMLSLADRKDRADSDSFFTFDSLVDVKVSSLEFILVPSVVAELRSAVDEAAETVTNATKARNRANDAAKSYMTEINPSITRLSISMENPMLCLAPNHFYRNTLDLTPGSFRITSTLSSPEDGVQWSTTSVAITGMSTRLLEGEMLHHSKPIDIQYSSALRPPNAAEVSREEPQPSRDNAIDDSSVFYSSKIRVNVPDVNVTLSEAQMLFLFRGVFEHGEVQAELAQRMGRNGPATDDTNVDQAEVQKNKVATATSHLDVTVGYIGISALSIFGAQISNLHATQAVVGPTTSFFRASVGELAVTHMLWAHLDGAVRRQLLSISDGNTYPSSALLKSPCMTVVLVRELIATGTTVVTPEDMQTIRDTRINVKDAEVALSPDVAKDVMARIYEPMNAELFRTRLVPEPALHLRHTSAVVLGEDLTLTNMRYMHVAGDDISTYTLDLGGHTLSLSGMEPSPQIALAEDVLLTIKNGTINIPGLYSLDSFIHFGAGSRIVIDKTSVDINQRLWRLSGSYASKTQKIAGDPLNDERIIDLMSGGFTLGVHVLTTDQALNRYLAGLRRGGASGATDADELKRLQSDVSKALILTARPSACVEVGLLAKGKFQMNVSVNPATGKPVQQSIDVILNSLQSFEGKLLRRTDAQVQMIGVGNIQLVGSVGKIESLIPVDKVNGILDLTTTIKSVVFSSLYPVSDASGAVVGLVDSSPNRGRLAEIDVRNKCLGSVQGNPLVPQNFKIRVQMRDEATGLQYVTRPFAGICKNCKEDGHATLSLAGLGDPRTGTICPPCAFGKRTMASFSGGELKVKTVDILVVGLNGEMVEVTLSDVVLKQKAEEIMIDASKDKPSGTPKNHKEAMSETRTTLSVDFTAVAQIFNPKFTAWEPVLESLAFKLRGWTEDNIWHVTLPRKTETTLSNHAISTFTALGSQFGGDVASPLPSSSPSVEAAALEGQVASLSSIHRRIGIGADVELDAVERNESRITDVRLVNYLAEPLAVIEDRRTDRTHPIESRDSSIFPIEGSSCQIVHKERRLKIFLNQHAYFTMADLVVEVSLEACKDAGGNEGKRCVVLVYPVHKSGSLIRIISRVPCSMYNTSLGLLRAGEETYIGSNFPLVNPFVMEPRDIEGGPYSSIETVGTTVPSVRQILNGSSPFVVSRSLASAAAVSLSFRIRAESDGTVCGAPRFSIIIDGGRKITNNVLLPITVDLVSGQQRIHSFTIPPLSTRQIIFNSGSSGIHFKFTCMQSVLNGADDDEQAAALRSTSRGEVVADEAEGRYTSSVVTFKRGTQRLVLQNLLQNVMTLLCTLNPSGSELTLFAPFAIVNHTPLPLRLVEKTKASQRMTNWEFLPAGMSVPMPVVPTDVQETPELMTKVQALGHYETRDYVPLHAVETAGQIELLTPGDKSTLQFSYYSSITATGSMLITIVPRWVVVNRTPWPLHAAQFTDKSLAPVIMPPQTAHHCYRMQQAHNDRESLQMCLLDPQQRMETDPYDGRSEAMPFSIEELGDFFVTLPGSHFRSSPDRQLKVSVFPDGPRMFVTIEAVATSAYVLINRTNVPIALSKPSCPSILRQMIDADTKHTLTPQEVCRDVTKEAPGRLLVHAAPSEVRSFGLNGNTANHLLQCVVVNIGAVLGDGSTALQKATPSFIIPTQTPDGGVPSPDRPIHLMGVITCRISQGYMGRTIIEITPFDAEENYNPTGRDVNTQTERILLPPRPMSLDVGLNISYLSISLVEQPREILFGVFADVRARVQRTTEFEAYSFSILNFQFDNQSERKPPYEGCLFAIRPDNDHAAVQGFLQRRVIPGRAVACFTAVRLDLMPIALRLSDVLLFHLREFAAGISAGPKAEENARNALTVSHTYRSKEDLYRSAPIAVGRDAMMVTIERMVINPIVVRLWFSRQRSDAKQDIIRSSQNAFLSYLVVSCEDVMIRIPGLTMQSQTAQARGMVAKFKNFYLDGLKSQLFAVLFQYVSSIPLIGAPVKLVSDIGFGSFRVFQDRIDGLTSSPEAFAIGVASGTALVVGNVIGGSLNLVGLVAGGGAKLATMASGDSGKKMNTATGLLKGVTGIVTKPMHGAAEGGAAGFFKGLGQGVVGVATNPLAGILGDLSKATTLVGSVFTDKYIPDVNRLRPIRLFMPGGAVASIGTLAEVFQYQRKYAGDHFWTNNLLPTDGSNWKPQRRDEMERQHRVSSDAWVLDRRQGTTFDGWTYGDTISGSFHMSPEDTVHLRRRRWVLILVDQYLSEVVPPLQTVEISCPTEEDNTAMASPLLPSLSPSPSSSGLVASNSLKVTAVGAQYCSTRGTESETERVIDVYENQRRYPFVGWSSKLLPTDRNRWSDRQGNTVPSTEAYPLKDGWAWTDEWRLVGGGEDGWEFSIDFPSKFSTKTSVTDCVRRRVWRRTMRLVQYNSNQTTATPTATPTKK